MKRQNVIDDTKNMITASAVLSALNTNRFRVFYCNGNGVQKTLKITNNSDSYYGFMSFLICSRYSVTLIHIETDIDGKYFQRKTNVLAKRANATVDVANTDKEITISDYKEWNSYIIVVMTNDVDVIGELSFTSEA